MASKETLNKLSDNKLIDAVKNHKQYGYSEELRELAISILEERGISREQLKLTGNLDNKNFNYAKDLFDTYTKNSKIALIFYLTFVFSTLIGAIVTIDSSIFNLIIGSISWISLFGFPIFLIKSFINQIEFSKLVNEDFATQGAIMYWVLGLPFYILVYFSFRKDMREKMTLVK